MRFWSIAAILFSTVLFLGCEPQVSYQGCAFDPLIDGACYDSGSGQLLSCVISNHPDCLDRICLSYQGSTAFCSSTCAADGDCARGGSCRSFKVGGGEEQYCVAPELLPN
jgi:hypothetical protein